MLPLPFFKLKFLARAGVGGKRVDRKVFTDGKNDGAHRHRTLHTRYLTFFATSRKNQTQVMSG